MGTIWHLSPVRLCISSETGRTQTSRKTGGTGKVTIMGMELIIQLIAGAVGGNAAGGIMKNLSLGTIGNTVAGLVGGGLGGQLLGMLGMGGAADAAAATSGMDISSIIQSVAGGGVGGGVLLAVVGAIKKAMGK
jgi:uncharacterized membrane protein YeaQ/YmgE (transglycosylase-associated protein family)